MQKNNFSPKVSIVIPVYNGSNYLKEAIDSALAQTYKNIEILVVNDGSNDEGATESIAKSYGKKIKYYAKENGGVATALNLGIKKMTGEYFSWLSHDDLYEKTKIEDQIKVIQRSPRDTIVVCNARVLFESGIKKKALIDTKTFDFFDIFLATSADVGVNGCTLLIPRNVLIESGGFNSTLPVTQDYDLWYRLYSQFACKFVLIEKNLAVYRRHDGQDSVQKQKLCLEAGDELRFNILSNIDHARLCEYLTKDTANLKHAWSNYRLYNSRGSNKTASLLLWYVLAYCYKNNLDIFYKMYCSEVRTDFTNSVHYENIELFGLGAQKLIIPHDVQDEIEVEYAKQRQLGPGSLRIKDRTQDDNKPPENIIGRVIWRIVQSLRRDGILLTAEKVFRKILNTATRD